MAEQIEATNSIVRLVVSRMSSWAQFEAARQTLLEFVAPPFSVVIEKSAETEGTSNETATIAASVPAAHIEEVTEGIITALRLTENAGKGCWITVKATTELNSVSGVSRKRERIPKTTLVG